MSADAPPLHPTERIFVTPEGVDLRLNIGDAGQRAAAFLLDAAIVIGVMVAITLVLIFGGLATNQFAGPAGGEMVAVLWLVGFFLLRNFYFTAFELSAAAATPGKRVVGLRVAARDGGRLRAESVFARNALRELEVFLPLSLLGARAGEGGLESWIYLLAFAWSAVFVFFPLFNRDRLRLGDLVGGTWVVRTPRRRLSRDIADEGAVRLASFNFSPEQLEVYGAKELQVLEGVLRQGDRATVRAVARRISTKIGWTPTHGERERDFLSAYYAALRRRLEQRLLMGVRRRDKHDV
jgi:uncharacterized RDD family membrane protein YckC